MRGASSAPTERVLDVVELLSLPDNRQMRFSDVVRELELSQATAHAILKTLTDRGWVNRDPVTKTFSLGPALSVIAARLDTARPMAHRARDAARRLATVVDVPASVIERAGDDLVITAFEQPKGGAISASPNERIPYTAPFGVAFAAWDTPIKPHHRPHESQEELRELCKTGSPCRQLGPSLLSHSANARTPAAKSVRGS